MTTNWATDAACREVPGDLFFPVSYRDAKGLAQSRAAKKLCAACPVRRHCLDYITQHEANLSYSNWQGIYAGLTPAERHERLHGEPPSRKQLQTADLAAAA